MSDHDRRGGPSRLAAVLDRDPALGEQPALSYHRLRALIGLVGLTLPITCFVAGIVDGHLEQSISAYYYTRVTIVFTGTLCVVGVFLIAYRFGSLVFEGLATTVAGVAALGVAFFHAAPDHATLSQLRLADVHLVCATTLFVLLGAISLFVFPADVPRTHPVAARWYRGFGIAIWTAIVIMPVLNVATPHFYDDNHVFFALESVCVMAFALSFIVKGNVRLVDPEADPDAPSRA